MPLRLYYPVCPVGISPGEKLEPNSTFEVQPLKTRLKWLVQTDRLPQPPQIKDFVSIFRGLSACIEVLITNTAIFWDLTRDFAMRDVGSIFDSRKGGGGVKPDATDGRWEEVAAVLVILRASTDTLNIFGLDTHKQISTSGSRV